MSTSARRRPKAKVQRSFVPMSALAKSVKFNRSMMQVTFADGRILGVPLVWLPALKAATPAQRMRYELGGGGISLHCPSSTKTSRLPA
jgi:hypothetical protein